MRFVSSHIHSQGTETQTEELESLGTRMSTRLRMRMRLELGARTSMSRPETLSLTMRLSFAETAEELSHCFGHGQDRTG